MAVGNLSRSRQFLANFAKILAIFLKSTFMTVFSAKMADI
jgi:hypothetical protein